MRMLEMTCVAPPGFPPDVVHAAAGLDGLDAESREHSVARLRREALLAARERGVRATPTGEEDELRPSSEAVRAVVLRSMPPARLAELHRFLADATRAHASRSGALVRASIGHLRCEGGDTEAGSRELLEGATVAAHAGYDRSAVRIAASAVQYHPTAETRVAANRVTHALGARAPMPVARPSRPPPPRPRMATVVDARAIPDPSAGVGEEAIHALLAKDFERVDRCIELAIAEGRSLAAADRLRAMALLVRGDRMGAREACQRAREQSGEDPQQLARMAVLESWLRLGDGDLDEALRSALSALSIARRLRDPVGETAAMRTLALCYQILGRERDAKAIADAAPA
jgi:tetratricopeptide (TPR) repeat protein